jgi:ATP/maltotriose-dependent transcriptional regulator MalT
VELEPTLERRYNAARAAWKLADLSAVLAEMGSLVDDAERENNRRIQGRALTALADVTLALEGDVSGAMQLADRSLAVLEEDDHEGRFGALDVRSLVSWYGGGLSDAQDYETQALKAARAAQRKDLESKAALQLATISLVRMEEEEAVPLIERAVELAEDSGSIVARAEAAQAMGELHRIRGEYDDAEGWLTKAIDLFTEAGSQRAIAQTSKLLARLAWTTGELARAEKLLRESIRLLAPLRERGRLCESQRLLAQLLLEQGRLDEAEKYALAARETVSAEDVTSRATTRVALAQVRAAQSRDDEAETLFSEALEILRPTEHCRVELDVLPPYAQFLRERGRGDEAVDLEARVAELSPSAA